MTKGQIFLSVLLFFVVTAALGNQADKPKPVVVMIDHTSSGFIYWVNSERPKDILLALGKLNGRLSPQPEVILLVHRQASLFMVNNMIGILSKAGFVEAPRVFVFDSHKDVMNELNFTYSPRVPFSAEGDVPSKSNAESR